ncbi:septum formation initiator family protein [Desulforamulus hydrothermalis]|uniref:Cell division protein FtsL n=1 Tax=Desulforamulus hydrothermalis Lam5 = DSM 18033 TaxID=1121428 RepID=K8EAP7_9FIRM|nr:cell division protein FtsL [Desulforamulus hydrothermalis]CCO08718.1 Cell division protein FtsL [Desulforamulus hydrothermalis Lam5 = DSM 18033]SHG69906.1 cell division protein FtsL [Desulforamulus hydrothermalis Lam5 = DSM 18033]
MSVAQEKFSYQLPEERQQQKARPGRQLSKRAARRGKIVVTGCILALFLTGLTIAYYYAQVAAVGYQISRLQSEVANLQAEQEYLESQANQLLSLQRIEAIATTRLGMVKPDPKEVVLVAALPKSPQAASNSSTNQLNKQESSQSASGVQEQHKTGEIGKNPVIDALMDLVQRWEQKR